MNWTKNFSNSASPAKSTWNLFFLVMAIGGAASSAQGKLQVVTTTPDLRQLVETVGSMDVNVSALAKGTQDPHLIEAKPSFMVRLRDADLVIAQGLELEEAWIKPLIEGCSNRKIAMGTKGYLELGGSLNPLEVASGQVTRAGGDVHPGGNPHFQLDPIRMGQAARLIADRLAELDPAHGKAFLERARQFEGQMTEKTKAWQKRIDTCGVKEVVTHHKTFSYFLDRFKLKSDIQLEPRPGIPPTASHLIDVIEQMKKRKISLVLIEEYFADDAGEKIQREVPGVIVQRVAVSADAQPLQEVIEALVKTIERACSKK
ncbi:MAG: ABC transporter substrate-binding protein [Bdellovibrio sp.]|nr:MAG: ABC transporter substrate-binding protein [Bdellovibrio sp.]